MPAPAPNPLLDALLWLQSSTHYGDPSAATIQGLNDVLSGRAARPVLTATTLPGHANADAALLAELAAGEAASPNPFVRTFGVGGLADQLLMLAGPALAGRSAALSRARARKPPIPGRPAFEPPGAGRTLPPGHAGQARTPSEPGTLTAEDIAAMRRERSSAPLGRAIGSGEPVVVPETESALSTLDDWLVSRRTTTAQIRPAALEMRNTRRSRLDARGPRRPESVREAYQLERFRPKLEALVATEVAAAKAAASSGDHITAYMHTSNAQELVDRWNFLYVAPKPPSTTADFPTGPSEGRGLLQGATPSPYSHAAPIGGGPGSPRRLAGLAKQLGFSPPQVARLQAHFEQTGGINLEDASPGALRRGRVVVPGGGRSGSVTEGTRTSWAEPDLLTEFSNILGEPPAAQRDWHALASAIAALTLGRP